MSRPVLTVDDLDVEALEAFAADWATQYRDERGRVDWEGLVDRLERSLDWDLPTQWTDPVFARLKRIVRGVLAEMDV